MNNIKHLLVFTTIAMLITSKTYTCFAESEEEKDKKQNISVQEDLNNKLGLIYSSKKLEEATELLKEGKFNEAEKLINSTKDWLIEATETHYNLYQALNKQEKDLNILERSKIEKAHALDFGQLRDQSYYILAKAYIGQNKEKEAIKPLLNIIKSQSSTELGKEAYKLLHEIKFSDDTKN